MMTVDLAWPRVSFPEGESVVDGDKGSDDEEAIVDELETGEVEILTVSGTYQRRFYSNWPPGGR